jgi:bifunctional DNase/RNase
MTSADVDATLWHRVAVTHALTGEPGPHQFILRDEAGRSFQIFSTAEQVLAARRASRGVTPARPMTHDLMAALVTALGGAVEAVRLGRLSEGVFFARIDMRVAERLESVDARASDAINLALCTGAPILAAEAVVRGAMMVGPDGQPLDTAAVHAMVSRGRGAAPRLDEGRVDGRADGRLVLLFEDTVEDVQLSTAQIEAFALEPGVVALVAARPAEDPDLGCEYVADDVFARRLQGTVVADAGENGQFQAMLGAAEVIVPLTGGPRRFFGWQPGPHAVWVRPGDGPGTLELLWPVDGCLALLPQPVKRMAEASMLLAWRAGAEGLRIATSDAGVAVAARFDGEETVVTRLPLGLAEELFAALARWIGADADSEEPQTREATWLFDGVEQVVAWSFRRDGSGAELVVGFRR